MIKKQATNEKRFSEGYLTDPAFVRLLARSARVPFTWQELITRPLPAGMGAVETYRALSDHNRAAGVLLPLPNLSSDGGWYQMTMQITQLVGKLEIGIGSASAVYAAAVEGADASFATKMRMADVSAAARLDGLSIAEESVEMVAISGRRPANDSERFVLNVLSVEESLRGLSGEPFSKAMVGDMVKAISEGVDLGDIAPTNPSLGLITPESMDEFDADVALGNIVAYANDDIGDEYDPPLLRGMMLADLMRAFSPFGSVSSQVGRLMTKLYMLKHGMPVMAALPLSRARVDWEEGLVAPPEVLCTRADFDETARYLPNRDCTLHQTIMLQLALLELERAEALTESRKKADDEIGLALRGDVTVNARQRTIVARALRSPSAEFTIRYHQRNHGIAYATARSDLLGLVDRGFLEMKQRGKAFVFTPAPSLRDILSNLQA